MQSAAWNLAGRGGLVPNAAKYSSVSQEPSSSSSVLSPVSPSSSLSVRETKLILYLSSAHVDCFESIKSRVL